MKKPSKTQVGGAHYKAYAIQPAEFIHKNGIGFLEGNVIKYVCRHAAKHGRDDLLKAKHYIELLLEWQYGDDGQTYPAPICFDPSKISEDAMRAAFPEKPTTFRDITAAGRDEAGAERDAEIEAGRAIVERYQAIDTGKTSLPKQGTVKNGETWQIYPDGTLPFGWPYSHQQNDPDEVGELTKPELGAGLLPDHSPKPECCKHGLTICKVCEFGYPESI